MNKWWRYGLWSCVLVAVLAAAHLAFWQRYMVEKDFRQVELAVSYDEVSAMAGAEALTPLEGLREYKRHGVVGVVLREQLLAELEQTGVVEIYSGRALAGRQQADDAPAWLAELSKATELVRDNSYIVVHNKEVYQQILSQLTAKLAKTSAYKIGPNTYVIETTSPYIQMKGSLSDLGVGFSGSALRDIQAAGMTTILQIRTWPGATQKSIEKVFKIYRDIPNVSAVMFNDDTLPGHPSGDLLPILAEGIRQMHVPLIQIEFFNQYGLNKLGVLLDKEIIRLHTISTDELKKLSPAEAKDRFALAASERNHRILYFRPMLASPDMLQENLAFIDGVKSRLEKEGLTIGKAGLLPEVPVYRWISFIIGLGVIAGGLLLLEKLGLGILVKPLAVLSLLIWAGLLFYDYTFARKFMALASVIVFPTLSILTFVRREGQSLTAAVLTLLKISAFSLLGALFMVGLLADAGFMLKLDQFVGIKLAHVMPLVIVMMYFALFVAKGLNVQEKVRELVNHPVNLGIALAAGFMTVAVLIYVARTGNDAGIEVSGLELKFRSILDQVLGVRPRTKEFLLGHPALLIILVYGYRNNAFLPLLLLGAIGQASLVNTFAHIHTPLIISLARAFNGLWLGIVVGLVVLGIVALVLRKGRSLAWLK